MIVSCLDFQKACEKYLDKFYPDAKVEEIISSSVEEMPSEYEYILCFNFSDFKGTISKYKESYELEYFGNKVLNQGKQNKVEIELSSGNLDFLETKEYSSFEEFCKDAE